MTRREINLIGGFYKDSSLPWSAQDTVNWLPVPAQEGGTRSPMKLRGAPGLRGLNETVLVCAQVPGTAQRDTFAGVWDGTGRATIRATANGVYASTAFTVSDANNPVEFKRLSNTLSVVADQGFVPVGNRPPPGSSSLPLQLVAISENRVSIGEDGNFGLLDLQEAGSWRAYLFPQAGTPDVWAFGLSNDNRSSHTWFSETHVYLGYTRSSAFSAADGPITYRIYRWPLSASGSYVVADASSAKFNDGLAPSGPSFLFHRDRAGFIHCYNSISNVWRVFDAGLALVESFSPTFAISGPIGVDGPYLFHGGASTTGGGSAALFVRRRSDFSLVSEFPLPFLNNSTESFNFGMSFNDEVIVIQYGGRAVTIPYPLVCTPA
jgi:hypothetical protein